MVYILDQLHIRFQMLISSLTIHLSLKGRLAGELRWIPIHLNYAIKHKNSVSWLGYISDLFYLSLEESVALLTTWCHDKHNNKIAYKTVSTDIQVWQGPGNHHNKRDQHANEKVSECDFSSGQTDIVVLLLFTINNTQ